MGDNYNAVRAEWRQRFLQMDHERLAERFHLKIDGDSLYLTYFSHPCVIDRRTAKITRLDKPEAEIGFNQEMNFFNMFHYAIGQPIPSGRVYPKFCVNRNCWCKRAKVKRGGGRGTCPLPCVHINIKSCRRSRAAASAAVRQHLPLTVKGFYVTRAYDPRSRS